MWLVDWLERGAGVGEVIWLCTAFLVFNYIYSILAVVFCRIFGWQPSERTDEEKIPMRKWYFPFLLFLLVFSEEVLFRLPLAIFIWLGWGIGGLTIASVALSATFGFLHGKSANILIQGVGGFFFCLLFLKCGGFNGNYLEGIIATTATHFVFDGIIAFILLLCGDDKF